MVGNTNALYSCRMFDAEIRDFLRMHGVRLDTDAGQHFLTNREVLDEIVSASAITKEDRIWEIGPGIGVLTAELVKKAGFVTSVEIDPRFPPLIHAYVGATDNLTVIVGNALHTPTPVDGSFKVVANIPYHITSPLLTHLLLEAPVLPSSITLLIQREVAENICDEGSASILTVLVRLFGEPKLLRIVPPEAFVPPPQVDSAVIHIALYEKPLADAATIRKILSLAKHAMSGRRKMLRNTIGSLPGGGDAMAKAGIDPQRRPQTLTVHEWIALEQCINASNV